jgi:hypothetical protein
VKAMKDACGPAHMKSILAIGELGSMENVYKVLLLQNLLRILLKGQSHGKFFQ